MEKGIKKIILTCIIILIFICITILWMISYLKTNIKDQEGNVEELGGNMLEDYVDNKSKAISKRAYFDINTCMTQYLSVLNTKKSIYYSLDENGNYSLIVEENEIKKNIYDVLSTSYIERNGITIDNIYNHISTIDEPTIYVPIEANLLQNQDNIQSFLVHGLIETTELKVIDEIYAILNIDKINSVFSVEPIYEKYNNIEEIQVNQLDENVKIGVEFKSSLVSNENIAKDYINIYKRLVLGKPEIIYSKLDKDYREKRFENLEEFKKYIETNKKEITSIRVDKYKHTTRNQYDEYICIDQNENYYIFKEISPLQYTVILDNYTIPAEDFIETYNSSSDVEKVILNIKKFFMGIDDKNYGYSYSVLSEAFKNNKYPTKNDFIKYAEQNFFEKNEIEYEKCEKENGIYIYEIKITDATGKIPEEKSFNIILKLRNGTDYEMSFGEN